MKFFLILSISLGLMACTSLTRSPKSGYYDTNYQETEDNFFVEQDNYQQKLAKDELGYSQTRELNPDERRAIQARLELKRLEESIPSLMEKKHYYQYKPHLKNDLHRIYFLNLPSLEARERWAAYKGISSSPTSFTSSINQLIEKNDVAYGMSREAVRESWGDPDMVEYAGNPMYGNERWKYSKMVSSFDGYSNETRLIYFESGKVVGWEKE